MTKKRDIIATLTLQNFLVLKSCPNPLRLCVDQQIDQLVEFIESESKTTEEILSKVRQAQLIMNVTPDYKYYLLFCGLFSGKRNAAKSWPEYEECFL